MATAVTPTIVNLNTVVTAASAPSTLQQSGALVSVGATTLTTNSTAYCATLAQVSALLNAALSITSLAWSAGVVTATVLSGDLDGLDVGDTFTTTIAGAVPTGYNGTVVATVASATTFTYPLATNPGTETSPGTFTAPEVAYVLDAATTFFAQGSTVGLYVLELGLQASDAAGITSLGTWITNNSSPQQFYAYLVPAFWDKGASTQLAAMVLPYNGPSAQTYFVITTTNANLTNYAGNKAVLAVVPSPTATATEFQAGAVFYQWLVNNPGSANPLAPMAYRYLFGVTPWSMAGNGPAIQTALTAFGNVILTGAEGGISTSCLFKGTTMDGAQAASWYGLDWFRINVKQALAAAIINGSNSNPPLLYDQNGINTLLAVAQQVAANAVKFGCALRVTLTATDFTTYTTQNPTNYAAGIYNGLAATLTMQNGFLTITFNLDAVQFAGSL